MGCARIQARQQRAQGMAFTNLAATPGEHQQRPSLRHAPRQKAQQVQRGTVGPVHVFDHQHQRLAQTLQQGQHAGIQGATTLALPDAVGQTRWQVLQEVQQRREGRWRQQRLAAAPPPACRGFGGQFRGAKQRGLADAGLALEQQATPLRLTGAQGLDASAQHGELLLALQHGRRCGGRHGGDCHTASVRSHHFRYSPRHDGCPIPHSPAHDDAGPAVRRGHRHLSMGIRHGFGLWLAADHDGPRLDAARPSPSRWRCRTWPGAWPARWPACWPTALAPSAC
jgi:hypothetical protein